MARESIKNREEAPIPTRGFLASGFALLAAQLTGCAMFAQTGVRAPGSLVAVDPVVEVGAGLPYATAGVRMEFLSLDVGLVIDGRAPIQVSHGDVPLVVVPHLGLELLALGRARDGALGYLSPRGGATALFLLEGGNPESFFFVDLMGGCDQPFSPRWRRWYGEASLGIGLFLHPWIGG
jgi:hypothetical protein